MSDVIAKAPARANKTPARTESTPSPTSIQAPFIGANEKAIAATGASLLEQAAQCIHAESGTVYAGTLLEPRARNAH